MSKKNDKVTYLKTTTTIDYESGEILEKEETTLIKKGTEPSYIKLYVDTLLAFKELPKTLNPVLVEFLSYMTYADKEKEAGGQVIYVNSFMKESISKKLNMQVNTISKALTNLVKSGIFKRVGQSTYQVNPYLFGRGEWKDISAIRATFDFNTGEVITELKTNQNEEEISNEG